VIASASSAASTRNDFVLELASCGKMRAAQAGVPMDDKPGGKRWWWLNWVWIVVAATILTFGFATYNATHWRAFLLLGVFCSVALAIAPPRHRPSESWFCLIVVIACGLFGGCSFWAERGTIHPRDRGEFVRLDIGFGMIAGVALGLPYVLARLVVLRTTTRPPSQECSSDAR
jgi:hypothetical protein